jgi:hypothetical protein
MAPLDERIILGMINTFVIIPSYLLSEVSSLISLRKSPSIERRRLNSQGMVLQIYGMAFHNEHLYEMGSKKTEKDAIYELIVKPGLLRRQKEYGKSKSM